MIKEAITRVVNGNNLHYAEAEEVMREIMTGNTTPAQTAAYLIALHIKGESDHEISASAYAMRSVAERVKYDKNIVEIVGTGADNAHSINISTISGIVCAAAGAKVAKHGNRAVSSKCGAADCLEALGVNISTSPEGCVKLLDEVGMCFMFAQRYHSAMKYVGSVRKEIGIPTIFNILGPLTNPAHANLQLLGVYKKELLMPMAKALVRLGVKRGMAVYGNDRIDEISIGAPTSVVEFDEGGRFIEYEISPEKYGLKCFDVSELKGGDPEFNAKKVRDILNGEPGAGRTAVLMNAGAALHLYNGNSVSIEDGIRLAEKTIDSGDATKTLEKYIAVSNEVE